MMTPTIGNTIRAGLVGIVLAGCPKANPTVVIQQREEANPTAQLPVECRNLMDVDMTEHALYITCKSGDDTIDLYRYDRTWKGKTYWWHEYKFQR